MEMTSDDRQHIPALGVDDENMDVQHIKSAIIDDNGKTTTSELSSGVSNPSLIEHPLTGIGRKYERYVVLVIVYVVLFVDFALFSAIVPMIPVLFPVEVTTQSSANDSLVNDTDTLYNRTTIELLTTAVDRHRGLTVGIMFGLKPFVETFCGSLAGQLVDRCGTTGPMLFGMIVVVVSTIGFGFGAVISAADSSRYVMRMVTLYTSRAFEGVGTSFTCNAGMTMLAERFVSAVPRQRVIGIASWTISISWLMGPPIGGTLYEFGGPSAPFVTLAVVVAVDLGVLVVVLVASDRLGRQKETVAKDGTGTQVQQLATERTSILSTETATKNGYAATAAETNTSSVDLIAKQVSICQMIADPVIIVIAVCYIHLPIVFVEPTLATWMSETMSATTWQIGVVWLPMIAPYVVGGLASIELQRRLDIGKHWTLCTCGLVLQGTGCVTLPACSSYLTTVAPLCVLCLGFAVCDTVVLSLLYSHVDARYGDRARGRALAIILTSVSASYAFGMVFASRVAELVGFVPMTISVGAVLLLLSPLMIVLRNVGVPEKSGR